MRYTTLRALTLILTTTMSLFAFVGSLPAAEPVLHEIPTGGGHTLATDVYRPERVPAPVIVVRTPYGREGLAFIGEAFAARGYVTAIQDVRGRYGSTGEHEPFRHERQDGLATLRWVVAQQWCNGRIGMWGSSYSGYAALVVADAEIPQFDSIFSISGWLGVEDMVRPGGATHLMLNLPWMLTQQGRTQRNLQEFDVDAIFRHTPLRDALRSAGIRNATWEDPAWLEQATMLDSLGPVRRPVFQLTGWYDMVYRSTLAAWRRIAERAEAPQKLAIGPWYHNQFLFGSWEVGDASFGEASGLGTPEVIELSLRWFDATLRDVDNGMLGGPAVQYFLMEQNTWHTDKQWPPTPSAIREQRWYLDSAGSANGSAGDGVLSRRRPSGDSPDRFVFDPEQPVPTLGGANFFYFPELVGIRDQREIAKRKDVLVYTSGPLDKPLQITGDISLVLHVATSAKDTDFTAKLVVVRPDGYARIVEDGIARVSRVRDPVAPGEPFSLNIDLGYTAIAVPSGHRLRVEVSSSNFPKYDRNPNTGEDPFLAKQLHKAEQTVFHTKDRASYLVLPVRRKRLPSIVATRQPLVRLASDDEQPVARAQGDDAGDLLASGRQDLEQEQIDDAIAKLRRAVELKPEGSEEHHWLGWAYLAKLQTVSMFRKLGLSKKVRAEFTRAVELAPESVEARTSLANYYFQAPSIAGGSFDKGRQQVAEIKAVDPLAAHTLLADAYINSKKPELAKQELQAAIALTPQDADLYYRLGLLCQTEKQWDEAFHAFEAAAGEIDDLRSLYQVGRTAVFSGQRLERGQQAFEQYIERNPDSDRLPSLANARWRLGMIFEQQKRIDLARDQFQAALRLDPDLESAKEALGNLPR